jgi:4-amino-4-deoxy-L-arabinose transferase-like glycosyltransferase
MTRLRDYSILIAAAALLTLPNLGTPSFWDIDEGVNAEAGREMHEAGTWIIPTFNFELRTAKPVMLYWLQRCSYAAFGVSEWSARLPSVLASWLTILLTYELARRMFGRGTGLLAGLAIASAIEFSVLAHAATPDATLLLFTVLTYFLFWIGHENGSRKWWLPCAAACGLAMLTKGPVGVAVPGLVFLLYFAWNRELSRLWDRKLIAALGVFALVAGPWYGMVAAETRGEWARGFFLHDNLNRATQALEDHGGPIWYHAAVLLALFAPWSIFLGVAVWFGVASARTPAAEPNETRASRFLLCWFASYLVLFSLVKTKLPNYMLPVYPALAILVSRFLVRWAAGEITLRKWLMPSAVGGMLIVAILLGGGLLVAGGTFDIPKMRAFPGMESWAFLAVVPLAGAVAMGIHLKNGNRRGFVRSFAAASVAFTACLAAFPPATMDAYKAPRELARSADLSDPKREVRVAAFDWFQPSVVFYSQRKVEKLPSVEKSIEFLAVPTPGVLFVEEETWEKWIAARVQSPYRIAGKQFDFYRNRVVLAVVNEAEAKTAGR